jgi:hypothetical protein
MIKPTRNTGDPMTANLTPFEQSHLRAATAGARIIESLALNNLVTQARNYESDMSKLGNGTPPLSETVHIGLMWASVSQFAEIEA